MISERFAGAIMATLRERLAARPGTDALIREGARDVTVAEALAEGPKGVPPSARVLLSIHDTGALARTLVALDGGVEALLLASYSFSPEVIDALAQAAGVTHIVTDRAELLAGSSADAAQEGPAGEGMDKGQGDVPQGSPLGTAPQATPAAEPHGAAGLARAEAAAASHSGAGGKPQQPLSQQPFSQSGPQAQAAPADRPGTITAAASRPVLTPAAVRGPAEGGAPVATTWLMTTSGTTGVPKIVTHSVASLTRSVRGTRPEALPVWGLLYDMTRFAGMQVGLQAMTGHGTLAAIDRDAVLGDQVAEMAAAGVTHLSATPTLWRRLLMAPGVEGLPLRQITLGGEIAEQPVLDAIRARFPKARVTHIYASTEIGVGFAVNDGRAGFPESYLSADAPAGLAMRVEDGMLWLRPPEAHRTRYLGDNQLDIDAAGYVRSGDQVEIRDGRVHFLGRDSGVVNVGGVKVYPERVEAVLTADPRVSLAQVTAKSSPITGNLLVATIVPADPAADRAALKRELMAHAQAHLEREAVPAMWRFVDHLETNAAGKIVRSQAKA